jgi:hypothetical protein
MMESSGYFVYDEQYVHIDGTEKYLYWIRSDSDSMSMEKHLYRGRVKGGGVFNLLPIPEVTIW